MSTRPSAAARTRGDVGKAPEEENWPLWAIGSEVRELHDYLARIDGDLSETEVGEYLEAWFDGVTTEHNEKLDAYARLIGFWRQDAAVQAAERDAAAAEAARYEARRVKREKKAEVMERKLLEHFLRLEVWKHETGRNEFVLARAGGKLSVVRLVAVESMPAELRRETRKLKFLGPAATFVDEELERALKVIEEKGFTVTVEKETDLDDASARAELDRGIAAREERERRVANLVDGMGMDLAEAMRAEPPGDAESVFNFVEYGTRKIGLKIV